MGEGGTRDRRCVVVLSMKWLFHLCSHCMYSVVCLSRSQSGPSRVFPSSLPNDTS